MQPLRKFFAITTLAAVSMSSVYAYAGDVSLRFSPLCCTCDSDADRVGIR